MATFCNYVRQSLILWPLCLSARFLRKNMVRFIKICAPSFWWRSSQLWIQGDSICVVFCIRRVAIKVGGSTILGGSLRSLIASSYYFYFYYYNNILPKGVKNRWANSKS